MEEKPEHRQPLVDLQMVYFLTQQSPNIYGPYTANNNLVLRDTSMEGDTDYFVF